ncbi:cytochrome c [Neobacillus piezotolerans]|uniref:Cytochrome c n=1 Tax=Neobacillus piezotolerans TaxID=2259171 RepID=A0A3D8GL79_9BACI|nr:c-type cytochrome [Neobacillus piezotolerans]RDU35205.1 cytochrome c [Neobacillus piezotolerans]
MKKKVLIGFYILIVLIGLAVFMTANGFQGKNAQAVQAGEKVYKQQCAICHGDNGKGEGANAGTSLNSQVFLSSASDDDLVNYIAEGRPEAAMPAYGPRLSKEELKNVVAFIRDWQKGEMKFDVPDPIAGNAETGEKIYKRSCIQCHGEGGAGKPKMGTVLAHPNYLKYSTDQQIWINTAYGRENTRMAPSLKGLDGVRQLSKKDISDVVAYIRSLEKEE